MQENNPFDTEVEEYEKWFKTNDKLLASELEAIRKLLPTSGLGIEIGVGTGIFASKLGIKHGVEPSANMAAEAEKKGIQVKKGVAENLPIDDATYQYALMVTVDCFLGDVHTALNEVHRILTNNGVFIIAFLDRATSLGKLYEQNKHEHKSYKDANFHSAEEISLLLEEAGFEILDKKQTIFSLDNIFQGTKDGVGEGIFAVIKARSMTNSQIEHRLRTK